MSSSGSDCMDYAKQHSIMLFLVVIFFGVLIIPYFYKHVQQTTYQETDGLVKTIYYSQHNPSLSFVEITYTVGNTEHSIHQILNQHIQVGDHVGLFISPTKKEGDQVVLFQKPSSLHVPIAFMSAYAFMVFLCIYSIYTFYSGNKKK